MATSTTFVVKSSCSKHILLLLLLILGYGFQLICVNCSRSSAITMDSNLRSSGADKTLQEDTTLLRDRYVPQDENLVQIGDANANANAKFGDKATQPLNLAMPSHLRTNVPQDESLVPLAQSDAIINANSNIKFGIKPNVPLNLALPSHLRTNVPQGENSYLLDDGLAQGHSNSLSNDEHPHSLDDGGHLSGIADVDDNLHLIEYGDNNLPHNKEDNGFLRSPIHEERSFLIDDGANHTPNLVGVHHSINEEQHSRFIDDGFLRSPTHDENSKLLDDGIKSTSNEDESSILDNNSIRSPKHEEHRYFLDYGFLRSPTKEENSNLLDGGTYNSLGRPSLGRSRSCSINPMACEENARILGLATTPRCCGGSCVDISSSPNHCGACHNSCPLHLTCCNGKCTDLNSDPNNCGKCNQQYEVCYLGMGPYY